jgi:hypothetical protein
MLHCTNAAADRYSKLPRPRVGTILFASDRNLEMIVEYEVPTVGRPKRCKASQGLVGVSLTDGKSLVKQCK